MTPDFAPTDEPRPRDFSARIARRAHGIGARRTRHHKGRSAAILLGAVAIPALAAPGQWHGVEIGNAGRAEARVQPMPFETAGSSFPGSAFYYLADDKVAATTQTGWSDLAPDVHSDAQALEIGPTARALRIDNSGVDRNRALQCLTAAIYYEAASEPDAGQRAVAQVVLNRVAHPAFPKTVCGVVYQGSERSTGCQFTFTCDGSLARKPVAMFWDRARKVAADALAGYVYAPVGLATNYHTIQVHPYWADKLRYLGTIGAHRFYSLGGRAGQPDIFRFAYLGGEPDTAPHPHSMNASPDQDSALDPVAIQAAYDAGLKTARAGNAAGTAAPRDAAPAYTQELQQRGGDALYRGNRLPEATGIRPEYRNSGRWIMQPGS